VVLKPHEVGFVDVLSSPPADVADKDFSEALERLVGLVHCKMAGFGPDATREYYRRIADRAWSQLNAEEDAERKDGLASRHLNWLFMDPDYDELMGRQRVRGWHFQPHWRQTFGRWNWARDIDDSLRPAAQRAVEALAPPAKGVDLSGVDRFTVAMLRDIGKGVTRGGSGCVGGGCACACAGCACACACAGGGR
jgi:hypothetical protein